MSVLLCGRCKISLTGSYERQPYRPMMKDALQNTMNTTVQFITNLYSNVDIDMRNICCFRSCPCLPIKRHNGIHYVSHNPFKYEYLIPYFTHLLSLSSSFCIETCYFQLTTTFITMFVASIVITTRTVFKGLWYLLLINVISKSRGINDIIQLVFLPYLLFVNCSDELKLQRTPQGILRVSFSLYFGVNFYYCICS